jgi:hypothetical protein
MPDQAPPPHPAAEPHHATDAAANGAQARGVMLAAAAMAVGAAMAGMARRGPVGLLTVPPLGAVGVLLAWASAVQLGGGARFDDHPWV